MKRVFLDTNVILDLNLNREPFYSDAVQLFAASGHFNFFTSSLSIANAFYLVERASNTLQAKHNMEKIAERMECIITRNEKDFRNAALPVYSPGKFSKLFIT